MSEHMDLIARLRATKTQYETRSGFDGLMGFATSKIRMVPVNPDGPDAANLIEALQLALKAKAPTTPNTNLGEQG